MVTIDRSRVWPVLLLLTAILLVHPPGARAERIDINDPTVLGPVLLSDVVYDHAPFDLLRAVAEVRYAGGMYSYIYAVSDSPIFPPTFCCEGSIVSFAVTGHPLEGTWGAIYSSDVFWAEDFDGRTTKTVASITPLHDGFLVVPEPLDFLRNYTVVYAQSPLRPRGTGFSPTLAEYETMTRSLL